MFAYPDNGTRLPGKLAHGIDLKSDGGYVVAPPSLHASGDRYAWESPNHPDSVLVAPLPEWITPATLSVSAAPPPATREDERLDLAAVLNGVAEGKRNTTACRYYCRLRGKNLTRKVAAAPVDKIVDNTTQFPPFTMAEATKCLDSAWKHTPDEAKALATNADERAPTLAVRAVRYVLLDPPSPVESLVRDLILPSDRVVIGGARGAAKTWLGMGTSRTPHPESSAPGADGFRIDLVDGDLQIRPGHYYVDGILCEDDESGAHPTRPTHTVCGISGSSATAARNVSFHLGM